jgi:hypothetical protein
LEQWEGNLLKISKKIQKRFFRVTNHFLSYYVSKSKAYESPVRNLRGTYDIKKLKKKGGILISNVTVKSKYEKPDDNSVTLSLKFVDGTMRNLQGTTSEIRKLYDVLIKRQKWFEDVKDVGESNSKWQAQIETAAREHYTKKTQEDREKYDVVTREHLDVMKRDLETAVADLRKKHEIEKMSVSKEHEEARRRHEKNAPSVDDTMRIHSEMFRHESVCRKIKQDLNRHEWNVQERLDKQGDLKTRLDESRSMNDEKIRNQYRIASDARLAYLGVVVEEMNESNRVSKEEFEDMKKRHLARLERLETSSNEVVSFARSDLVAAKIIIESSHSKRLQDKQAKYNSELENLETAIESESMFLKSMQLRERYEHDLYVNERRNLKSKISNAKFKVRAKRDHAVLDLKRVKSKLNRVVNENEATRKDISELESDMRENTGRLNEMLNLRARNLNLLETSYESRAREVVLENEACSKEWTDQNKTDLETLKLKLKEQRRIAIEHMQTARNAWVRLSRGEDIMIPSKKKDTPPSSSSRFSSISLRANRVAEVMKSQGSRREIVISNLRRALRDRAVDLEMALGILGDVHFDDSNVKSSFDRALRSIDRLLGGREE